MNPWCTILIPTFNGGRYLPTLISSLLDAADQEYPVLFIDDASIDETLEIISAAPLCRKRILLNQPNLGLFATLNNALQEVETEYVSLIFQDNLIERAYFQQMRLLIERYPQVSFFWTEITEIDEFDRIIRYGLDTCREELILPGCQPWRDVLRRGCVWTIGASISKTERLRHHRFRSDLPQCGDYEFLLRAIREDVFLYFERPLIKLRNHRGNASFRYSLRSIDIKETILVYREQWSRFEADFDPALRLSLRRSLVYHIMRRSVSQARRGFLLQAIKTLALLPKAALSFPHGRSGLSQ